MVSSTGFTDDILIEIFTYLPLNSIYKFKCLSKVWLCNLSNPNFITKWFQINSKSLPLIHYHSIAPIPPYDNPLLFENAYPDSHSDFMSRNEHLFSFKFLINEIPFQVARLYLLGSSYGLVLCYSFNSDYKKRTFHVCNPLTKKWVSLPSPPRSDSNPNDVHVNGIFCENSTSGFYKVVRIPTIDDMPLKKFTIYVFSSALGEWKSFRVKCDEDIVLGYTSGPNFVILNGVLFWIEGMGRMLVYYLNQNNERSRCSLIRLPDKGFVDEKTEFDGILGESEGCVCYARTRWSGRELTLSVWVLSEANCWKIVHSDISLDGILAEMSSRTGELVTIHVISFSPVDRNVVVSTGYGCLIVGKSSIR